MGQPEKSTHTTTDPAASLPRLPATLRLGAVHLTVSDLDRSVAFYEDAIGLRLHHREGGVAAMGVGEEDLLVLYEDAERRAVEDIASCLRAGVLRPHIGMRFPLERIAEAHEAVEGGRSDGRVVVEVG